MLILLSESKRLNFDRDVEISPTKPRFEEQTDQLVDALRGYSMPSLGKLMGISEELAVLNYNRFAKFYEADHKSAISAFDGDAYQTLRVEDFSAADLSRAQEILRIMSGLYGMLRPADEIVPHRLEQHTKLAVGDADDLYEFWGERVSKQAEADLAQTDGDHVFLNLASKEYSSMLTDPESEMVSPRFEDTTKAGKRRVIAYHAKRARGAMTAWVIKNGVNKVSQLADFDVDGYEFDEDKSTPTTPVFWR